MKRAGVAVDLFPEEGAVEVAEALAVGLLNLSRVLFTAAIVPAIEDMLSCSELDFTS